ncbi:MAG: hypothetical protein QOF45_2410 [Gaiellaceae bacterium]|nr:hypothetical protein [Gaiellaceae bacterium]
MPDGGRLTINVATAALESLGDGLPCALLSVTDEGSGMDMATASHIFEPSRRGEMRGPGPGSGSRRCTASSPRAGDRSSSRPLPDAARPSAFTCPSAPTSCHRPKRRLRPRRRRHRDDPRRRRRPHCPRARVENAGDTRLRVLDAADGEQAIAQFDTRERPIPLVISHLIMRGLNGRRQSSASAESNRRRRHSSCPATPTTQSSEAVKDSRLGRASFRSPSTATSCPTSSENCSTRPPPDALRVVSYDPRHGAWRSLVSALVWGTRGPEFESRRPD